MASSTRSDALPSAAFSSSVSTSKNRSRMVLVCLRIAPSTARRPSLVDHEVPVALHHCAAAVAREADPGAAQIVLALAALDEPAGFHARDLVRNTTLLPADALREVAAAQPALRRLEQGEQDLVVGGGDPGIPLQLVLQGAVELPSHGVELPPDGPLFFADLGNFGHPETFYPDVDLSTKGELW